MPNAPPARKQTLRSLPTPSPLTPLRRRTSIPARKTSHPGPGDTSSAARAARNDLSNSDRSEEHTSELQSRGHLVCRLLLEKKKSARDVNEHTHQASLLCRDI